MKEGRAQRTARCEGEDDGWWLAVVVSLLQSYSVRLDVMFSYMGDIFLLYNGLLYECCRCLLHTISFIIFYDIKVYLASPASYGRIGIAATPAKAEASLDELCIKFPYNSQCSAKATFRHLAVTLDAILKQAT